MIQGFSPWSGPPARGSFFRMKSAGKVVAADDVKANVELIAGLLGRDGYSVLTAGNGAQALDLILRELPDLVLSDVLMPGMNGYELCRRLKLAPETRMIPVVLITSLGEREDRIEGLNSGADDFITKPVNAHELRARVRSLVRLRRYADDLDSAESLIRTLAVSVEARDGCTAGHCERIAAYATAFGAHLDLTDEELGALNRGGYLHDIGKIAVPETILRKPGKLSADEYSVMQQHTVAGDDLCASLRTLELVRPIVRHHHERLDGSGYPDGLTGEGIPFLAQIIGMVDVFDALTTERPYRTPVSAAEACAELQREAQSGWRRRDLVEEFTALVATGRLMTFDGVAAALRVDGTQG